MVFPSRGINIVHIVLPAAFRKWATLFFKSFSDPLATMVIGQ